MTWFWLPLTVAALGAFQLTSRIADLPRSVRAGTSFPVLLSVAPASVNEASYLFLMFYRGGEVPVLQYVSPALQDNRPGDEEPRLGIIKSVVRTSEAWLAVSSTPTGDRRQRYEVALVEQRMPKLPEGLVVDLSAASGLFVTGSVGQVALGPFLNGHLTQVERQVSVWEKPTATTLCKDELFVLTKESQSHVAQCGPLTVPWTKTIAQAPPNEVFAIARAEELKGYELSIKEIEGSISAVPDATQRQSLIQRVGALLGRIKRLVP